MGNINILQEIAERAKERVEVNKQKQSLKDIAALAGSVKGNDFLFERSLKTEDIALIGEVKKASPSKGLIAEDFPYLDIAQEYESAGVAAVSVLTEPYYFKGDDRYLSEIARRVHLPLLRKDFTVDSYMIYEAKVLGASAVLLIISLLDNKTLTEYISIAHSLGLSALVEAHSESEVEIALNVGARIIGVNNRDLKTFEVDITLSERLRKIVPHDKIFVSESGVSSPNDIARLREIGADAVLIGETIMRSADKKGEIRRLLGKGS
ncbi:MAG: indole-3-glycerol phosphate synthase TrpC [Planctomycetaceae bacterium]|jgi:indole-3-glycerol phosphate synthase|nr:indole-3-glycerol phosphate synthase TrpC [Planctomycetaceae bacterium]